MLTSSLFENVARVLADAGASFSTLTFQWGGGSLSISNGARSHRVCVWSGCEGNELAKRWQESYHGARFILDETLDNLRGSKL